MLPLHQTNCYQNNYDINSEFDLLMQNYMAIVHTTEGCGCHLQGKIDLAYAKLVRFVSDHPEFGSQLPEKVRFYNEGTGEIGTGSAGGNCVIS